MGYQFIHIEAFSRKADAKGRDTDFIFAEASRKPESCGHVVDPALPRTVFGVCLQTVQEMHDVAAAEAILSVEGGKARKIRKDQKTLCTVVASHPYTMDEVRADPAKWKEAEEWETRTVRWLQTLYRGSLKTVVRHEDEAHWHIHAFIVPTSDGEMRALKFHPGVCSKRAVIAAGCAQGEDAKGLHKRADMAYKKSMRAWQDSYHEHVGIVSGLARLGPKRRHLTRAEWHREQVQAKALKTAVQHARNLKALGDEFVTRTKLDAEAIREVAAREREIAEKVRAAAIAAQQQAAKSQEQAKDALRRAEQYSGVAGRLKAMWDALGDSKLAAKIRQEFSDEIARIQAFAKTVQERLKVEQKRRVQAEQRAHEAQKDAERSRDAALRMQIERDRAYALLPLEKCKGLGVTIPAIKSTLKPWTRTRNP